MAGQIYRAVQALWKSLMTPTCVLQQTPRSKAFVANTEKLKPYTGQRGGEIWEKYKPPVDSGTPQPRAQLQVPSLIDTAADRRTGQNGPGVVTSPTAEVATESAEPPHAATVAPAVVEEVDVSDVKKWRGVHSTSHPPRIITSRTRPSAERRATATPSVAPAAVATQPQPVDQEPATRSSRPTRSAQRPTRLQDFYC